MKSHARFGTGFLLAIVAIATVMAAAPLPTGLKPPPPPPEPLTWTGDTIAQSRKWDVAVEMTAAHVEAGYDDWRLPTPEEAEAAILDGSWGTWGTRSGSGGFWTSKRRGNWAWAYFVSFENGVPIPETLEIRSVYWVNGGYLDFKGVRP